MCQILAKFGYSIGESVLLPWTSFYNILYIVQIKSDLFITELLIWVTYLDIDVILDGHFCHMIHKAQPYPTDGEF